MTGRYGYEILVAAVLAFGVGCGSASDSTPRRMDPQGAALLGQAQQAYLKGQLAQALAFADSATTVVPDLPDAWFLKGRILGDMYRFKDSDAAYNKALELDPAFRSAHYHVGHNAFHRSSYGAMDGYRKALRHYEAEADLLRDAANENDRKEDREALATVLLQIGTTYHNLNRPDSAKYAYRSALAIDSTLARGYAWLAGVQQSAGELEKALENARRASELEPENPEYTLLIGVVLNGLERYEEALPYLSRAASKVPWNRTAVYTLGNALVATGREEEGADFLARADSLELLREQIQQTHMGIFRDPQNPIRWENYAYLLHQAGQEAEARRALVVLRQLMPADSLK